MFEFRNDWKQQLKNELNDFGYKNLIEQSKKSYSKSLIFPPLNLVYNSFNLCSYSSLKVVIVGQDPYHKVGQADGLCFSVNDDVKHPPSLKNIFKELKTNIPGFEIPKSGNLSAWSKQGVLLLNSILTVESNKPGSHKNFGWQNFTDLVIHKISSQKKNIVFLLWGNYSIKKSMLIDSNKHLVLTSSHPSPLARGKFFGNNHFSKTNAYLIDHNIKPINWHLK